MWYHITGKTGRLATTRWEEHNNPIKSSKPFLVMMTINLLGILFHQPLIQSSDGKYWKRTTSQNTSPSLMNKLVLVYSSCLDMELLKLIETTFAFEHLHNIFDVFVFSVLLVA